MPIASFDNPDRDPGFVCADQAKRALAVTFNRLVEYIISIPTDQLGTAFNILFKDSEFSRKANELALEIEKVCLNLQQR